jgi:hypothetical protein
MQRFVSLGAILFVSLGIPLLPGSAVAATSAACTNGNFSLVLPSGQVIAGQGKFKISRSALPSNGLLRVRGRYIEFDVNVSTFAVYNYTLTGAANPEDITGGVRTVLFTRKEPDLAGQTLEKDDLEVEIGAPSLQLLRKGRQVKMKIQAKDCAQGGIFQMEPESENAGATFNFTHTLASPGIFYFTNPYTGKVNFGNSATLRGKDSPQVAAKLFQNEYETVWNVQSGGRMGGVLGEDAVESSPGATSCTHQCQAQNRIQGSVPILDPVYENDAP